MILPWLNRYPSRFQYTHSLLQRIKHYDLTYAFPHLSLRIVHKCATKQIDLFFVGNCSMRQTRHNFLKVFIVKFLPLHIVISQFQLVYLPHGFEVKSTHQVRSVAA